MNKLNSKGFSPLHILLLIVIVGMIGGVGYYVYSSQKKTNTALDNSAKSQSDPQKAEKKEEKKTETKDETADWTPFSSTKGIFSLRYPNTWVQPENKETCNADLFDRALYLGPDKDSVLRCGTEYFGLVSFSSVEGDKQSSYSLGSGYKDVVTKDVTVGSVKGTRVSGVAKAPEGQDPFTPLEGTIEVRYIFYTNNTTYSASYTQNPKSKVDVLKEFDLIVTKTLKFQP